MTASTASLVAGTLVLGAGTYAFRFAGPVLRSRMRLSLRAERLMGVAAVVLLAALVTTTALFDGHHLAGAARPLGVAAGGLLAWRRAPFVVVVVAAAAVTAGLRAAGIS